MHTRCAPVRHSRSPEGDLPSDLHVLGLPLAFILSQDQTLRCNIVLLKFCILCLGFRLRYVLYVVQAHSPHHSRFLVRPPQSLTAHRNGLCAGLKLSKNFRKRSRLLLPFVAGCKDTTFTPTGNDFFSVFFDIHAIHWFSE